MGLTSLYNLYIQDTFQYVMQVTNSGVYPNGSTSWSFADGLGNPVDLISAGQTGSMSVLSSSYSVSASYVLSSSYSLTSSYTLSSSYSLSSSYAVSASWAPGSTPTGQDYEVQYKSGSTFGAQQFFKYFYPMQSLYHGFGVTGSNGYAHAEGGNTRADGLWSHAEGGNTRTTSQGAHSEGYYTTASGQFSHAEGYNNKSIGDQSHAEGYGSTSSGSYSHAEGFSNISIGSYSHAEGFITVASGTSAHSEGYYTLASSTGAHAEGYITTAGVVGYIGAVDTGIISLDPSYGDVAASINTFYVLINDSGYDGIYGIDKFQEDPGNPPYFDGTSTIITLLDTSISTTTAVISNGEDASNLLPKVDAMYGIYAHAEGYSTIAAGNNSHAEGILTLASGDYAHAAGSYTNAHGYASHTEGNTTKAYGVYSHAEGEFTYAFGASSHAEGLLSTASADYSHAGGLWTVADGVYQTTIGKYNLSSSTDSAFIIGNGVAHSSRSNLLFAAGNAVQITGSLLVRGSITGSLFGTSSWAQSSSYTLSSSYAISSSYALTSSFAISSSYSNTSSYTKTAETASYANQLYIGNYCKIDAIRVTFNAGGSLIEKHIDPDFSNFNAVFYDYVIVSASNSRAGNIIIQWISSSVASYNISDVSTVDIGNTSGVVFSGSSSPGAVTLEVTSTTDGWTFNATAKHL